MPHFWEFMITIISAGLIVAVVAAIVSKKSNTSAVIQSFASGYSNILATGLSPITGAVPNPNLSYPGEGVQGSSSVMGGNVF